MKMIHYRKNVIFFGTEINASKKPSRKLPESADGAIQTDRGRKESSYYRILISSLSPSLPHFFKSLKLLLCESWYFIGKTVRKTSCYNESPQTILETPDGLFRLPDV